MQRREDLENLIEQIDACRAGSDDIHAPELQELRQLEQRLEHDAEARELYDSLQNFDARLGAAVREVRLEEFPQASGLEARLLAAVLQAAVSQNAVSQNAVAGDTSDDAESTHAVTSEPPTVRRNSRRRAIMWLAGLAATAASVGIVYYFWSNPAESEFIATPSWVHETALEFYLADENVGMGRSIEQTPPPKSHPLSNQVRRFPEVTPGVTWRNVGGFLSTQQAVAYDIPAPGGNPTATLYVVRRSVPGLPPWPGIKPAYGTGGVSLSAWQSGDLVYVLVVPGGEDAYRQFIENLQRELA